MDAALYEKLLDELRSDMSRTTPRLQELQTVETFLQQRLEVVQDKTSYQNVLSDNVLSPYQGAVVRGV
jgi:hypothetical protein